MSHLHLYTLPPVSWTVQHFQTLQRTWVICSSCIIAILFFATIKMIFMEWKRIHEESTRYNYQINIKSNQKCCADGVMIVFCTFK